MNKIECPYCEYYYGIEVENFEEDMDYEEECPNCGQRFLFAVTYELTFWPRVAYCLNGAEHRYEPARGYPTYLNRFKCRVCGKIKRGDQE